MEKFEALPGTRKAIEDFRRTEEGMAEQMDLVEIDLEEFYPYMILYRKEAEKMPGPERQALFERWLERISGGYFPIHVTYTETDPETGKQVKKTAYELPRLFMSLKLPRGETIDALSTLNQAYHGNPRVDIAETSLLDYGSEIVRTQYSDRQEFVDRVAREQIRTRQMMERKGAAPTREEKTHVSKSENGHFPSVTGEISLDDD